MRQATMAKVNASRRPERNGAAMSEGKNFRPVISDAWGSLATVAAPSRWVRGLYPKKEANSTETGGRCDRRVASLTGTPAWTRPCASEGGKVPESPEMSRVKKIPIERTWDEF